MQKEESEQKMKLLQMENQYMLKNLNQLKSRFNFLVKENQENITNKQMLFQKSVKQIEQIKNLEINYSSLEKINQLLENKLKEITEENLINLNKINMYQTRIQKLQNEIKLSKAQLNQIKSSQRQNQDNFTKQNQKIQSQLQELKKKENNYFTKIIALQKQLQENANNSSKIKQELIQAKNDNQQMLAMLEHYQTKNASLTHTQNVQNRTIGSLKQQLQSSLLQKDKLQMDVEQLENKINILNQRHREELQEIRKAYEEINIAKNRVIEDKEYMLANEKKEEIERERIILEKQKKRQRQKQKKEKQREQQKEAKNKISANLIEEIQKEKRQYKEIMFKQKLENIIDQKQQLELQLGKALMNLRQMKFQLQSKKNISESLFNQNRQQKEKILSLEKQLTNLQTAKREMFKQEGAKLNQIIQTQKNKIQLLEQKLNQSIKKQNKTKQETIKLLKSYDDAQEMLKREYQDRIRQLMTEKQFLKLKNL